jgi:hypothetical protein
VGFFCVVFDPLPQRPHFLKFKTSYTFVSLAPIVLFDFHIKHPSQILSVNGLGPTGQRPIIYLIKLMNENLF